ncbi:HNH endonuclease signature motif containing protein [Corynebacterium appendicis]|uniref:HNH endonuclease signature motif containing protein n=1 Tax=Corynebacterium appendicis TaxID=163202 RepID=UPI002355F43A|nr:HNH endonuclease signature motif containing protein [Corynebacterium appendicis]
MSALVEAPDPPVGPFFASENPDDPMTAAGIHLRRAQHAIFGVYATHDEFLGSHDADAEVTAVSISTGLTPRDVKEGMFAYMTLQQLPKLRELQDEHQRLDIKRLRAIEKAVNRLGNDADPDDYAQIDQLLVSLFTPKSANQQLPTPYMITRQLNQLMATLDCSVAFDAEKKKKRGETPPGFGQLDFHPDPSGVGLAVLTFSADNATMAAAQSSITAAARKHGLSDSDAALKLLTGRISAELPATIFAYAPKNRDGTVDTSKPVFIPRFGWSGAVGTEMFHSFNISVIDLDRAAAHTVAGYVAPDKVKAYVRGRDGTCVYPGCERDAWGCQLDHRIPFDEGGLTNAENLYCLCQHHHNMKTDRLAFYVPDPVTGEIVWLFSDGTYAKVEPNGMLADQTTPTNPKWSRSLDDVKRLKRENARFFAQCHKVLDDFEQDFDYAACIDKLQELEEKFGLRFPFHPQPMPSYEPPPEED